MADEPWRRVTRADLLTGAPALERVGRRRCWRLRLDCGHEATRPLTYRQSFDRRHRQGKERPIEDAAPAPGRVRCWRCGET